MSHALARRQRLFDGISSFIARRAGVALTKISIDFTRAASSDLDIEYLRHGHACMKHVYGTSIAVLEALRREQAFIEAAGFTADLMEDRSNLLAAHIPLVREAVSVFGDATTIQMHRVIDVFQDASRVVACMGTLNRRRDVALYQAPGNVPAPSILPELQVAQLQDLAKRSVGILGGFANTQINNADWHLGFYADVYGTARKPSRKVNPLVDLQCRAEASDTFELFAELLLQCEDMREHAWRAVHPRPRLIKH